MCACEIFWCVTNNPLPCLSLCVLCPLCVPSFRICCARRTKPPRLRRSTVGMLTLPFTRTRTAQAGIPLATMGVAFQLLQTNWTAKISRHRNKAQFLCCPQSNTVNMPISPLPPPPLCQFRESVNWRIRIGEIIRISWKIFISSINKSCIPLL